MKKASLVIKSNAVFTGLNDDVFCGGIAIWENKIVAVGGDSEIAEWISADTEVLEYGDQLIMPGFIDAHMHFFTGAFVNSEYMLMDLFEAHSEEECVKMVEAFAKEHPDFVAITGMGWFPAFWEDHDAMPHCRSLDAVVSDRPVYLLSADCHTFWLNSKALEICGITKDTTVSFGKIGKDENGGLNGLLFEIEACTPANERAFVLSDDKMKELQKKFYFDIAKNGITSTTNMSVNPILEDSFKEYEVAAALEKEGELTVRLHLYPSLGLDTNYEKVRSLREKYSSEKLRVSGLKQFVDGVTSTYTAYMLEPYSDNPETVGFSNYPAELYENCIIAANKEGFGVRLHCIGDAAVRLALDGFEKSNQQNDNGKLKNTIEHIESIHADDIPRFAQLGVVASMQPIHLPLDVNEKVSRIGEERCQYEWPFKTMLENNATLAFGTDFPVAGINPFPNIYAAVTRCDERGELFGTNPQERISLAETLKAYTYGSACAINREKELGTLEAGKLADIIVLDKNIFAGPKEEILNASVKLTIMDGQIVFKDVSTNN
jgi:predicted amidohydrolase YtcJ